MRYILLLPFLISAAHAQFVSYPSSSSSGSVVTNAGTTSFTNDFSSNPTNGLSGWVFMTSTTANVFWDSGSNAVAFHWLSGASGTPWFGFTSDTARANGVYTMNWQTIAIADSGGRSDFLELMTDGSTNARVNLGLETRGLGQQTQIITGEWNCIRFLNEGGGGGNVKMWIDNVFLNDTNVVYYITTNSGSGTSGSSISVGGSKVGVTHR